MLRPSVTSVRALRRRRSEDIPKRLGREGDSFSTEAMISCTVCATKGEGIVAKAALRAEGDQVAAC